MLKNISILLACLDRFASTNISQTLSTQGASVTCVSDFRKLSSFLAGGSYTVAIIDTDTTDIQNLCRIIKDVSTRTEVIITSAYPTIQQMRKVFLAGTADFLLRPFNKDDLCATVHLLANRAQSTSTPAINITGLPQPNPENLPQPDMSQASLKQLQQINEKKIIIQVLENNLYNRNSTAKALGLNRATLYKKMKQYKLL